MLRKLEIGQCSSLLPLPRPRAIEQGCILDREVMGHTEHLFFPGTICYISLPQWSWENNKAVIIYTAQHFCQWSFVIEIWEDNVGQEGTCEVLSRQREVKGGVHFSGMLLSQIPPVFPSPFCCSLLSFQVLYVTFELPPPALCLSPAPPHF